MSGTLDTSGVVTIDGVRVGWSVETSPSGFYLTPFDQGYIEALFADVQLQGTSRIPHFPLAFSDLVPETLAAILKDCAAWAALWPTAWESARLSTVSGRLFWRDRSAPGWSEAAHFPPLTPYLGDDGKVYLRTDSPRSAISQAHAVGGREDD